jgi:hypothetical protein
VLFANFRLTAGREQPGSVWYSSVRIPLSGTYLQRVIARAAAQGARLLRP